MSKVISGKELETCRVVQLPSMVAAAAPAGDGGYMTVGEFNEIYKQAYDEGFALGKKEGRAAGEAEIATQVQQLRGIVTALGAPLADVDDRVVDELARLALAVAKHMVRREIKTDPAEVVGIVREALDSLPVASANIRVQLHPEDAALVRAALSLNEAKQTLQIIETPVMTRGGCRLVTDTAQVDATVEARFAAIAAAVMGGEREHDDPAG